jgi:hypothetical protein
MDIMGKILKGRLTGLEAPGTGNAISYSLLPTTPATTTTTTDTIIINHRGRYDMKTPPSLNRIPASMVGFQPI